MFYVLEEVLMLMGARNGGVERGRECEAVGRAIGARVGLARKACGKGFLLVFEISNLSPFTRRIIAARNSDSIATRKLQRPA